MHLYDSKIKEVFYSIMLSVDFKKAIEEGSTNSLKLTTQRQELNS